MQAELQAARAEAAAHQRSVASLTAEVEALARQSAPQHQGGAAAEAELAAVKAALAAAEGYAATIRTENERLMEISNELHAELRSAHAAAGDLRQRVLTAQSGSQEQAGSWLATGMGAAQHLQGAWLSCCTMHSPEVEEVAGGGLSNLGQTRSKHQE